MRNTKLGNIFLLLRNGASIKQYDNASGFPITRIETIANKEVDRQKLGYANIFDCNKYKDYILNDNDILMSHINSEKHLGKVAIYKRENDETIIHGMNLLLLRPNCKLIVSKYIYYYFDSKCFKNQIVKITKKSVNQASFTVTALKDLEITIPSLSEQQRIANELDKVSELIDKRQTQLQKLDLLIKSKFVEMFGEIRKSIYPIKTLEEICVFIKDGTHQTPIYTEDKENGYKFLSSKDVTSGKICWDKIKYIPKELHEELYSRIKPQKGDILLAKNGTTGIPAIVENDEVFDIYVSLALLRLKSSFNVVYVWASLLSQDTQEQFNSSLKGIGVPNLHLGEIKKAKVIIPPIELQNQFADFVDKVEQSKAKIKASLDKLITLKKALMQKYFD